MEKIYSIKFGGQSGQGVKTSGFITLKSIKDLGLKTFAMSEYPSLIKGGHSTYQICFSKDKISSVVQNLDILIALNEETIKIHYKEILENGWLVYDSSYKIDESIKSELESKKINLLSVPASEIVQNHKGLPVMINSAIFGTLWRILSNDFEILEKRMIQIFGLKGKDSDINIQIAKEGFNILATNQSKFNLQKLDTAPALIGTGNEVAGLSIYASGCRFFVAYPMTPSSGILHYLASRAIKYNMIVKQAEDEISAVLLSMGANYAGTRSACGTSGGGLALMTEAISLAGMTETPLVIFDSQRPAPATGMPTWTEQGDLNFVLNIGHGEFPRIILAPGDIKEVFELTSKAFNLAEKYQTPVIVLLDKYLSESWFWEEQNSILLNQPKIERGKLLTQEDLNENSNFLRYKLTEDGISPKSIPGMKNGEHLANSDEHDEKGYSTEDTEIRIKMMGKRSNKINSIINEFESPEIYWPKEAKNTILCWGSTKGPATDAMNMINSKGNFINVLHFKEIYPLKTETIENFKNNNLIAVENNYSGQFADLVQNKTGIKITKRILKFNGSQFYSDELAKLIKEKIQ